MLVAAELATENATRVHIAAKIVAANPHCHFFVNSFMAVLSFTVDGEEKGQTK